MPDLFTGQPIPVGEKVAELQRELRQRRFVFPRLIAKGRLTHTSADRRIEVMEAILADYEQGRVSG